MTTAEQLVAAREACERATPGPFAIYDDGPGLDWSITSEQGVGVCDHLEREEDAAFFAIARTALPLALDRIAELEAALSKIGEPGHAIGSVAERRHRRIARQALGKP